MCESKVYNSTILAVRSLRSCDFTIGAVDF